MLIALAVAVGDWSFVLKKQAACIGGTAQLWDRRRSAIDWSGIDEQRTYEPCTLTDCSGNQDQLPVLNKRIRTTTVH